MITYLVGLVAVAMVYSLFMACWLDGRSAPSAAQPGPPPSITDDGSKQPQSGLSIGIIADCIVAFAAVGALWIYSTQARYMKTANQFASAQLELATKATEQTQLMIRMDQRPWLRIEPPVVETLKTGSLFKGRTDLSNSGKSPAKVVDEASVIHIMTIGERKPDVGIAERYGDGLRIELDIEEILRLLRKTAFHWAQEIVVPPGSTVRFMFQYNGTEITDELIADIKAKRVVVVAIQFVRYLDSFGARYQTYSTFTYDPAKDLFVPSYRYNYMD